MLCSSTSRPTVRSCWSFAGAIPARAAALWAEQLLGGSPRRIGSIVANGGGMVSRRAGNSLRECRPGELARSDGTAVRQLAKLPDRAYLPRWSPDGATIRFTAGAGSAPDSIMEVAADGSHLHRLFPDLHDPNCCGVWTPDGKYFVFTMFGGDTMNVWAVHEKSGFLRRASHVPVQLTAGPINFQFPVSSPDGKRLYVVGSQTRSELVILNSVSGQFVPYLSGISAADVSFSRDGKLAAYVASPEGTLWRSSLDGGDRTQLTFPPLHATLPRWSPDGKQIAFFERWEAISDLSSARRGRRAAADYERRGGRCR